jgi:hypothetical protein
MAHATAGTWGTRLPLQGYVTDVFFLLSSMLPYSPVEKSQPKNVQEIEIDTMTIVSPRWGLP